MKSLHFDSPARAKLAAQGLLDLDIVRVETGRWPRLGDRIQLTRPQGAASRFVIHADQPPPIVTLRARLAFTPAGLLRVLGPDGDGQAPAVSPSAASLNLLLAAAEQGAPDALYWSGKLANRAGFDSYAGLWDHLKAQGGVKGGKALREMIAWRAQAAAPGGGRAGKDAG